jgi:hypothetical protein
MTSGRVTEALDKAADRQALTGYQQSYPLDFNLYDGKNGQPVLYITDNPLDEHSLTLMMRNIAPDAVQFKLLDFGNSERKASKEKHHLELIFRANTISAKTLDLLKTQKDKVLLADDPWDMAVGNPMGETISIYLWYKNESTPLKLLPKQGDRIPEYKITLRNFSVASVRNARSTQVEVKPAKLCFIKDPSNEITSSRLLSLYITGHEGSRTLPMHFGFQGSNRVLNDGVSETKNLVLELMNIARSSDGVSGDGAITLRKGVSTFDLTADYGDQSWALCKAEEFLDIKATVVVVKKNAQGTLQEGGSWELKATDAGQARDYVLSWSPSTADISLEPGESILFKIQSLKSSATTPGPAKLYLRYAGIPGYWNGQLVCLAEKSPLMYGGGNAGIGNTTPDYPLVVGPAKGQLQLVINDAPTARWGFATGNYALAIQNDGADKKWTTRVQITKDGNVGIGTATPDYPLVVGPAKGQLQLVINAAPTARWGFATGNYALAIQNDGADKKWTTRVQITKDGNVGIGTENPGARLEVAGALTAAKNDEALVGLTITPTFDDNTKTGVKHYGLLVTAGNVGIGNTTPDYPLVVGPAKGQLQLVVNDVSTARWGFATGDYALSIQNEDPADKGKEGYQWKTRVKITGEGNLLVNGSLTVQGGEQLPMIDAKGNSGWQQTNAPIVQYFRNVLSHKPIGTMVRAVANHPNHAKRFFIGWVNAQDTFLVTHSDNTSGPESFFLYP